MAASTPTRGACPRTLALVVAWLLAEQIEARRRDDGSPDAFVRERLRGLQRDRNLRARCDQGDVARTFGLNHDIGAESNLICSGRVVPECRQRLPRQAQDRWRGLRAQRAIPGFRRFDGIRRTEHEKIGNGAQRGEMLDRLMGRAILAKADGVMRHHMDDANAHQRGQPDRGPVVIGEGKEGSAIGDESAMQRRCRSSPPPSHVRGRRNGYSCRPSPSA